MQLTQRERFLLMVAVGVFGAFVGFFGLRYLRENVFVMEDKIEEIRQSEFELESLGEEYERLKRLKFSEKATLDPMVTQLEEMLRRFGIYERARMKTTDVTIENKYLKREVTIELSEITSQEMLQLIKGVESNSTITFVIENFYSRPLLKKPGFYWMRLSVAAMQYKK